MLRVIPMKRKNGEKNKEKQTIEGILFHDAEVGRALSGGVCVIL